MMRQAPKPFSIKRWTIVTFLGWLLGVLLLILLSAMLDAIGVEHMQFYVGIGMGAGVGMAQWFFLRKQVPVDLEWIWIAAFGMGLPFVVADLLLPEQAIYKLPLSVATGAAVTGMLQARLIARKWKRAYLWFWTTLCGWSLGAGAVFLVSYTAGLKTVISSNLVLALVNLLLLLSGGIVLGLVTGIALRRILSLER